MVWYTCQGSWAGVLLYCMILPRSYLGCFRFLVGAFFLFFVFHFPPPCDAGVQSQGLFTKLLLRSYLYFEIRSLSCRVGLKFSVLLPQPASAGITGMSHHAWLVLFFTF